MRILALCSFAVLLHAQQEPENLLAHVQAKVKDAIDRLSNYMCTQTVERNQYVLDRAPSCAGLLAHRTQARQTLSDRLTLDVGVGPKGEMYSWVGENRFHDNVNRFASQGAISNGSFDFFLKAVFETDHAEFSYDGEQVDQGRRLAGFRYQVSRAASHYELIGKIKITTAYEGTFLVDPKTFDLVRLIVRTQDLPRETGSCQAETTLDYRLGRLNDSEFLLPATTRLQIVNLDGAEKDNLTVFSACHEFRGESTLSFGDPADVPAAKTFVPAVAVQALAMPDGLPFEVVLTQDSDTAGAAVGDRITAQLASAIRGKSSTILAPAGAVVTVRIVEMRHLYEPPVALVSFRLESLNIGGSSQPFTARAKSNAATRRRAGFLIDHKLQSLDMSGDRSVAAMMFSDPIHRLLIKRGLKSSWSTGK